MTFNRGILFPHRPAAENHHVYPESERPQEDGAKRDDGQGWTEPRTQRRRDLQACVARLLEHASGQSIPLEKRTQRRFTFRKPLVITPVDNSSGRPDRANSFAAFGIDISPTGICFLARRLLRVRRAIVSCEGPNDEATNLSLEPRWVRFTRGGWYQTGGRLLEVLELKDPVMALKLWNELAEAEDLCRSIHPKAPGL